MLAEVLSRPPESFLFCELGLNQGRSILWEGDVKRAQEIDPAFDSMKMRGQGQFKYFKNWGESNKFDVYGTKEIAHHWWPQHYNIWPDQKIIFLGRDPKDIFISMMDRTEVKKIEQPHNFTSRCHAIWNQMKQMMITMKNAGKNDNLLFLRYEDFVAQPEKINAFISDWLNISPVMGKTGSYLDKNQWRKYEHEKHGNEVSQKSTSRFAKADNDMKVRALQFEKSLGDYNTFWGYKKEED
jgi:hypothetical protein